MPTDLSGTTSMLLQWLVSPFIWLALIILVVAVIFGFLIIRKRRKLIYSCLEIVNLGEGKSGFNIIPCGWFGKKRYLRGLWDTGEEVMRTKDGEIIVNFSTEDFQEVNGKRGVVCYRDPINQDVLVPVSKARVKGSELLAEIAPQEFRDVALDIIKDADKETADKMEKLIQWIIFGTIIIFALVSIIVIVQMVKQGQKEASELILKAGETCLKNAREVCSEIAQSAASGAP